MERKTIEITWTNQFESLVLIFFNRSWFNLTDRAKESALDELPDDPMRITLVALRSAFHKIIIVITNQFIEIIHILANLRRSRTKSASHRTRLGAYPTTKLGVACQDQNW